MQCVHHDNLPDPLTVELSASEREERDRLANFLELWFAPIRFGDGVEAETEGMVSEAKGIVMRRLQEFEDEDPGKQLEEVDLGLESEDDEKLPPLTVEFLDIGMGSSTLFVCGDGTTVLIDCGCHNSGDDVPAKDGLTFLKSRLLELQGFRKLPHPKIDRVYITHADQDHYNLFPSLFELVGDLEVGEFHIGGNKADYKSRRDVFEVNARRSGKLETMKNIFARCRLKQYPAPYDGEDAPSLTSEDVGLGTQVSFRVLCANTVPKHRESKKNASSIVVLVEKKSSETDEEPLKILMMGDGERTVEERLMLLHKDTITNVDFLHVGHHGAELAGTASFLSLTNPKVAQLSADQVWGHPYRSTVERITKNPELRVNSGMANDTERSIVVGEAARDGKSRSGRRTLHRQEATTSSLLLNIPKQEEDTSTSQKAVKARREGATPVVATGQQWSVIFRSDNSFTTKSTLEDQNDETEYL